LSLLEEQGIDVSVGQKVRLATTWLAGTRLVSQLLTMGITLTITRLLDPADFGLFGMANLVISFLTLFEGVGLDAAIIQKQDMGEEELDRVFWLMVLINIGLYVITFLFSPLMARFFREEKLSGMIRILGINLVLASLYGVPYNLMTRDLAFDQRSKAELASGVGHSVICLILVLAGWKVWSLIYSSLATPLIMIAVIYYFSRWTPRLPRQRDSRSAATWESQRLLNFGSQIMFSRTLWYIYSNSDFLIAGRVLGKEALGNYTLAFELASLPLEKVVSLIPQIAYPTFSQVQQDEEKIRHYFLKTSRLVALIVFPLFLGIFLVAKDLILLVLTSKWAAAINPLKTLCLMSILRSMAVLSAPLTNALGRPGIALFNSCLCALFMPVAFWVGARSGIEGISLAWLLVYPFLFLIMLWNSIRIVRISMKEYWTNLLPVVEGSVVMTLLVFGLKYIETVIGYRLSVISKDSYQMGHRLFFSGKWAASLLLFPGFGPWFRLFFTCLFGAIGYLAFLWMAHRPLLNELWEFARRD
jgi:teichuronic acid exporter